MKKVDRVELRKIIMNEMNYTHSVVDDRGDGGYGIKNADRSTISANASKALKHAGILALIHDQRIAFSGTDKVSDVVLIMQSGVGGMSLSLYYKGLPLGTTHKSQREAFSGIGRYYDAHRRQDYTMMPDANKALADKLQVYNSDSPDAMELASKLSRGRMGLSPLIVTDYRTF